MSYNVTISGTDYEGIDMVKLPITDSNETAVFYATSLEDFICGRITSFESDTAFQTYTQYTKVGIRPYTFYSCSDLESVSLPNTTCLMASVFEGCGSLKNVNVPEVTTFGYNVFASCTSLEEIAIPKAAIIASKLFNLCSKLKKVDASVAKTIEASAFNNCSALEALILRNDTMVTLANVNAFSGSGVTSGTGYIYVPRALVDTYKADSKWSTYANQFRAIEDYPDICG